MHNFTANANVFSNICVNENREKKNIENVVLSLLFNIVHNIVENPGRVTLVMNKNIFYVDYVSCVQLSYRYSKYCSMLILQYN